MVSLSSKLSDTQDKYLYFRYDYVRIYSGDKTSSDLLDEFTGNTSPGTLTYSSSPITIKLQSDDSIQRPGFSLEYSSSMFYIELPNINRFITADDCIFQLVLNVEFLF